MIQETVPFHSFEIVVVFSTSNSISMESLKLGLVVFYLFFSVLFTCLSFQKFACCLMWYLKLLDMSKLKKVESTYYFVLRHDDKHDLTVQTKIRFYGVRYLLELVNTPFWCHLMPLTQTNNCNIILKCMIRKEKTSYINVRLCHLGLAFTKTKLLFSLTIWLRHTNSEAIHVLFHIKS